MTRIPRELREVDWSQTTFAGARREQMRRWAELPLERIIASLEEMERLADAPAGREPGEASSASA
ncbi:MAG TPA: hypothetical protein VMK53_00390 [Gemmatimonadales bacterium]|nr:hypothetical protein [Gemmatimonadales bacterium]